MGITTNKSLINRKKLLNAFPINLKQDVEIVADFLIENNLDIHPTSEQKIILDGKELTLPGRVYFDIPTEQAINSFTISQQTIVNCICLRHHNSFVRQQHLEKLIHNVEDYYVIPFIFQLVGEYVVEILEVADKHINEKNINTYLKFFKENPKYRQQTESRMVSYWNEYYRRPKFSN